MLPFVRSLLGSRRNNTIKLLDILLAHPEKGKTEVVSRGVIPESVGSFPDSVAAPHNNRRADTIRPAGGSLALAGKCRSISPSDEHVREVGHIKQLGFMVSVRKLSATLQRLILRR